MSDEALVLLVIVAQFKDEKLVKKTILEAGATGVTYFYGRGAGVRQRLGFLGNLIQKEKVIFLTAVPQAKSKDIMGYINKHAELDKPGRGFSCVLKLDQVFGLI